MIAALYVETDGCYYGLGGWAEGLLAEGWDVVGFDIERHEYGAHRYPAQLVVQDVLTLHGSQFAGADLIVASPPCQEYSYMAMPWRLAKAKAAAIHADASGQMLADLNRLFLACFRIQREACEAAGRHIPMVVENVRGAIPWIGRSRWNYGSFHLWGDVPALMPQARALDFTRIAGQCAKVPGFRFEHGVKCGGDWFNDTQPSISRMTSSKSPARKMASAMIAKIPLPLARHIAAIFRPVRAAA